MNDINPDDSQESQYSSRSKTSKFESTWNQESCYHVDENFLATLGEAPGIIAFNSTYIKQSKRQEDSSIIFSRAS